MDGTWSDTKAQANQHQPAGQSADASHVPDELRSGYARITAVPSPPDGTYTIIEQWRQTAPADTDATAPPGIVSDSTARDFRGLTHLHSFRGVVNDLVRFWQHRKIDGEIETLIDVSSGDGVPAGTSVLFAGNTVPSGWLIEDGSAVSRTDYADLFAAIGTLWGIGDGSTTFNLPDSGGKTGRGWITGDPTFGTVGNSGGVATLDLDHKHCLGAALTDIVVTPITGNTAWNAVDSASPTWNGTSNPPTIDKPDGSHEVDNRGPYNVKKWMIKT